MEREHSTGHRNNKKSGAGKKIGVTKEVGATERKIGNDEKI